MAVVLAGIVGCLLIGVYMKAVGDAGNVVVVVVGFDIDCSLNVVSYCWLQVVILA